MKGFSILCRFLLPLTATALLAGDPFDSAEAPVLEVSLAESVRRALLHSYNIHVESFEPRIAGARITRELGAFDPELAASYTRAEETTRFIFIEETRAPARLLPSSIIQTDIFDVRMRGLTPLGTRYGIGAETRNTRGTSDAFNDTWDSAGVFDISQPLLRGFGPASTLAGVRIARKNLEISEWQFRAQVIDTVTQTVFVYNDLYFAMQNLRVARRARELAQQLFNDNDRRAEIGVMSPLDVSTARAEVAAREEAVILAERAVRDNKNFLKQLITDRVANILAFDVAIAPPPLPMSVAVNVEAGIGQALELRPDYRQARLDLQRRNITLAFERNAALPRLDLVGSLRLAGAEGDIGGSFSRASSRDRTSWSGGAVLSVPIPNREGRGRVDAVNLQNAQALIDLKRLEQDIVVRVDNAAGQILTTRQRIAATEEATRLAQETLEAGQDRLRAGATTTFDVLELQKRLIEAEVAAIRARTDLNKAVTEYQRQTGTTLDEHEIVLAR